jgi:hypothetical protein
MAPGSSTWVAKTGYTTSATYSWNTYLGKEGTWQIAVWARQQGSTAKYQAYAMRSQKLIYPACRWVSLSASAASPQAAGTSITFTADGGGDCGTLENQFLMLSPGSSRWVIVKPYATASGFTWTWNSTGAASGVYRFGVWVRLYTSTRKYDAYDQMTFWIS